MPCHLVYINRTYCLPRSVGLGPVPFPPTATPSTECPCRAHKRSPSSPDAHSNSPQALRLRAIPAPKKERTTRASVPMERIYQNGFRCTVAVVLSSIPSITSGLSQRQSSCCDIARPCKPGAIYLINSPTNWRKPT